MAKINDIKIILKKALPDLSPQELETLATAIAGTVDASTSSSVQVDENLLKQAATAQEVQAALLAMQKEKKEVAERDLQIALEIDRLSGQAASKEQVSVAQTELTAKLAQERLAMAKQHKISLGHALREQKTNTN